MESLTRNCITIAVLYLSICLVFGDLRHGSDEEYISFVHWKLRHNKVYSCMEESVAKFVTYSQNLQRIERLNREHEGKATFEPNQFADMSPEEFSATVLMRPGAPPKFEKSRYLPRGKYSEEDLPETFDWRDKNVVTSVKNQGSAGTCWAFSTVGNIEGQFAKAGRPLTNFSVEQIVDCDPGKDPQRGYADCGVYGGWPYLAYQYVMKAGGLQTWEDYGYCCGGDVKIPCLACPPGLWNNSLCGPPMPYCNMSQSCSGRVNPSRFVKGSQLRSWTAIDPNETTIANNLMSIGPLSVAMDAELLQFYKSGVFNPIFCSKTNLNHAVLLVGFGTSSGFFGKEPYWTVKNSWAANWGEKGYFRIKRGAGVCGINTQVTTANLKE